MREWEQQRERARASKKSLTERRMVALSMVSKTEKNKRNECVGIKEN